MVHCARQIGVGKRNSTKWRIAQDLSRGSLASLAKEKPGLGIQVSMTPAVKNYSSDVPPGVEAGAGEHLAELLADLSFVIPEGGTDHLCAALVPLLFRGATRIRIQNFQAKYDR